MVERRELAGGPAPVRRGRGLNPRPRPRFLAALLVPLLELACGGGEPPPEESADTAAGTPTAHFDSATGSRLISPEAAPSKEELQPVRPPGGFPEDFPFPAGAAIVDSASSAQAGARYTGTTIILQRNAKETFDWYRGHLSRAGWMIGRVDQRGQAHILGARRGSQSLTLIVQVHPEYPGTGWIRILANVVEGPGI